MHLRVRAVPKMEYRKKNQIYKIKPPDGPRIDRGTHISHTRLRSSLNASAATVHTSAEARAFNALAVSCVTCSKQSSFGVSTTRTCR